MPRPLLLSLACALAMSLPATGRAEERSQFDVLLRSLRVAEITLVARDDGTAYALAGQVRSTGLLAAVARVRFSMQAEGLWDGGMPRPLRYVEDIDTGRRATRVDMRFHGGLPDVARQEPAPGPEAVPPAQARGHADPLSALWRLARGGAVSEICGFTLPVYDGARRSELSVDPAGGSASCRGRYTRLAGFPPEDLAERQRFPFTAHFTEVDGAFVLTEVEATSLLGPIRIVRRD
jgi:hypothetical protein